MYKVVVGSIVCWQKEKIGNSLKVHPTVMTKTTLWTPMQTLKIMRDSISMWKYHSHYINFLKLSRIVSIASLCCVYIETYSCVCVNKKMEGYATNS